MSKLITCNYQGRLGNLMFEIATTLAAAWDNNMVPSFPKVYNSYYKDISAFQEYILPILEQFHKHESTKQFDIYHEGADFAYKPITVNKSTCLNGYFTSSLYFNKYRKEIINLFSTHQNEVNDIYGEIKSCRSRSTIVSVHVRRTDYVTDYGWDSPLDYYKEASEIIERQFSNPVYVVFSDDHQWCRENLGFMRDKFFVNEKDYIELQLIGKFDAHISANSTFSAMGIILGDPEMNKTVIAPKQWIPGVFNKDIVEPHWTLI